MKEFERLSIEKYVCENKIKIRQPVSEMKIFKDFVSGCHGNNGMPVSNF